MPLANVDLVIYLFSINYPHSIHIMQSVIWSTNTRLLLHMKFMSITIKVETIKTDLKEISRDGRARYYCLPTPAVYA